MKSKLLFLIGFCLFISCKESNPQQVEKTKQTLREVCITVDDLPVVGYQRTDQEHLRYITEQLISHFKKYDIPAIGYVNEGKLYPKGKLDSSRVELLELWLKNGYELGNHTYSHANYHQTPFNEYTKDILKGEKITKPLVEKYGAKLKYFRHPYLRIGNTKSHHDSLRHFLSENGYIEAPVTIDNDDYLFALAYHKAFMKDSRIDMDSIGNEYISYMEKKLDFYESMSEKLFQRNIKQTLLIHANLLNANYLNKLAEMYKQHGYSFVSQSEVLTDSAYTSDISKYGNWGISWLDRWALSKGKKGDFFKDDPATPEYITTYK